MCDEEGRVVERLLVAMLDSGVVSGGNGLPEQGGKVCQSKERCSRRREYQSESFGPSLNICGLSFSSTIELCLDALVLTSHIWW